MSKISVSFKISEIKFADSSWKNFKNILVSPNIPDFSRTPSLNLFPVFIFLGATTSCQPGSISGSPWRSWRVLLASRTPGISCELCQHHTLILNKKMDGCSCVCHHRILHLNHTTNTEGVKHFAVRLNLHACELSLGFFFFCHSLAPA